MKLKGQLHCCFILLAGVVVSLNSALGAIYQWEWVNPGDHSLGKQASNVLIEPGPPDHRAVDYANLTMAYLPGANFYDSYAGHVIFDEAYLANANFESSAFFEGSTFINADLTGANFRSTYLYDNDFSGANFTNADLTGAEFLSPRFYGANFIGAHIQNAGFWGATHVGLTAEMIYSTGSYQEHNLSGIYLGDNDLQGWDLSSQNLTNAWIGHGKLQGLNLRGSDLRGAPEIFLEELDVADTTNAILLDGRVRGLNLDAGEQLNVWDYDGYAGIPVDGVPSNPAYPIHIEQQMSLGADSTIEMLFEADDWNSTISFDPGISVALGGNLELLFAPGVDPATQIGRTFDLFDWTGVQPTGGFNIESPYAWDVSKLYSSGEVRLVAVPETATGLSAMFGCLIVILWRYKTPAVH